MRLRTMIIIVIAGMIFLPTPAHGDEDERFWSTDPTLSARVDSLGTAEVARDVRGRLESLQTKMEAGTATHADVEIALQAMRWAAILADRASLPILEKLAALPRTPETNLLHGRVTYLARTAAYRIVTRGMTAEECAGLLGDALRAEQPAARTFAQEMLMRLGQPGLAVLLDFARDEIIPRYTAIPDDPVSVAELQPEFDYLAYVSIARMMLQTPADRAMVSAMTHDDDPAVRAFAEVVLATEGREQDD